VAAEPVGDTAAVGTVVAVRCDGFERDGRVVRKAETVVGKAPDGESVTAGSPAADTVASGRSSAPHGNGRGETMKPGP
jgi:hypothetical protein